MNPTAVDAATVTAPMAASLLSLMVWCRFLSVAQGPPHESVGTTHSPAVPVAPVRHPSDRAAYRPIVSWVEEAGSLRREFVFGDFTEAFAFMTRVAFIAERLGHHPDWSNTYNRVEIVLTTHDEGNVVTENDRTMAAAIDDLVG